MGFMFALPFIMVPLVFMFVIGMFVYTFSQTIKEKRRNDNSPRLTVSAKIVDKRSDVHRHHHDHHHHYSYTYYVTFEFESGDRSELRVPENEFGILVVGDSGDLTFQGTRYLGFARKRDNF
jgi:hypothetical protein